MKAKGDPYEFLVDVDALAPAGFTGKAGDVFISYVNF